jgi:catechol 2,3-dioxygenase-like lactoylglutathione lyase family enzyme
MLAGKDVMATVAVRDVKAARKFYEGTLGLKLVGDDMPEAPVYQSGKSRLLVYQSQYAGTNKATAATWPVGDDIEQIVKARKGKGVRLKAAWFKDPDGNILALVSG